jgi:hypothetical protein
MNDSTGETGRIICLIIIIPGDPKFESCHVILIVWEQAP